MSIPISHQLANASTAGDLDLAELEKGPVDKPRMDEAAVVAIVGCVVDEKLKTLVERLDNMPAVIRGDLSGYADFRALAEPYPIYWPLRSRA